MIALGPSVPSRRALPLIGGTLYTIGIGFHLWRGLPPLSNSQASLPTIGALSGDLVVHLLAGVAVLLFVSRAAIGRGRGRYLWAKWAKWGAIAALSAAFLYAFGATLLWALGASR